MIKVGISSGPTHFDGLTCRNVCLTSESEIEGTFKKKIRVNKMSIVWNNNRRGIVKNRTKIILKGFRNTPNFEFGDNIIILFKFGDIFTEILRLVFKLLSTDFNQ
jgi:hypothetical protein